MSFFFFSGPEEFYGAKSCESFQISTSNWGDRKQMVLETTKKNDGGQEVVLIFWNDFLRYMDQEFKKVEKYKVMITIEDSFENSKK